MEAEAKVKKPRGPCLNVNVTSDIIDTSIPANSSHCMIAEAVKATYPEAKNVAVDISTIRFTDSKKGYRYIYLTPRVAQGALVDFDEGVKPIPFHFRLRNAHVTRSGSKGKRSKDGKLKSALHKTSLVAQGNVIRRVGGPAPPQLHTRREFGVRAFRGARASQPAPETAQS